MILLFIYFWLCPTAFGILVPWLLESNQCPFSGGSNHQTSRKVLDDIVLNTRGTIVLICVKTSLITQISNAGDLGLIPGSGRSLGEGNGNPFQYSCLENSVNGGARWATVHGVAKSQTRLSDFTFVGGLLGKDSSLQGSSISSGKNTESSSSLEPLLLALAL